MFPFIDCYESYTIVEPSSAFLTIARTRGQGNAKLHFVHGEVETRGMELSQRTYDFVILSSLIHEVAQPDHMLAAVILLMGANTVLHINCPNVQSMHRLLGHKMGLLPVLSESSELAKKFQRHSEFSLESLSQLLEEQHLDVIAKGSSFIKPFSHAQMQAMLDASIVTEETLLGLYALTEYFPEFGSEIYVEARRR